MQSAESLFFADVIVTRPCRVDTIVLYDLAVLHTIKFCAIEILRPQQNSWQKSFFKDFFYICSIYVEKFNERFR